MISSKSVSTSMNTVRKRFTALRSMDSGVVSIVAPSVPPNTISAAVTCATSEIRPPSISSPIRMPPMPIASPTSARKSGLRRPMR